MQIACDEAGHTGPDLLAADQRFFAFASLNISDEEAWALISEARQMYPVQMPELKASKLMGSNQGRRLIAHLLAQIDGRFAVNAHDKLLALCGWVFEYIFEPVYQDDPRIFYAKDFHRFIAMFCYLWFQDERSEAQEALQQFQAFMRSKDTKDAPALFEFNGGDLTGQPHPFELIQRFATGHRETIAQDIANIKIHTSDRTPIPVVGLVFPQGDGSAVVRDFVSTPKGLRFTNQFVFHHTANGTTVTVPNGNGDSEDRAAGSLYPSSVTASSYLPILNAA